MPGAHPECSVTYQLTTGNLGLLDIKPPNSATPPATDTGTVKPPQSTANQTGTGVQGFSLSGSASLTPQPLGAAGDAANTSVLPPSLSGAPSSPQFGLQAPASSRPFCKGSPAPT